MQRGLVRIYCSFALGSCELPRNMLWRKRAVGKIRTNPSATESALVTHWASNIEIIFIYNLFDHSTSKKPWLLWQLAPKLPNYLGGWGVGRRRVRENLKTVRCERQGTWSVLMAFSSLLLPIFLQLLTYIELHVAVPYPRGIVSKICSP